MSKAVGTSSLGVMIERHTFHGTEYIRVLTMRRETGADHPLNLSFGMFEDYGDFADLMLSGFVTDRRPHEFIAFDPIYADIHAIDYNRATAMAKVLGKVKKVFAIEQCTEPGDVFMAFCKVIGAKWVAIGDRNGGSLRDKQWRWLTILDGRGYLRRLITDVVAEEFNRHGGKVGV